MFLRTKHELPTKNIGDQRREHPERRTGDKSQRADVAHQLHIHQKRKNHHDSHHNAAEHHQKPNRCHNLPAVLQGDVDQHTSRERQTDRTGQPRATAPATRSLCVRVNPHRFSRPAKDHHATRTRGLHGVLPRRGMHRNNALVRGRFYLLHHHASLSPAASRARNASSHLPPALHLGRLTVNVRGALRARRSGRASGLLRATMASRRGTARSYASRTRSHENVCDAKQRDEGRSRQPDTPHAETHTSAE